MCAPRLRDFVLVMGKNEIYSAAVNIEYVAEIRSAHGGAFNVPTRTTPAPRAFPSRLVAGRLLPQYKVERAPLMGVDRNARAWSLLVELAA